MRGKTERRRGRKEGLKDLPKMTEGRKEGRNINVYIGIYVNEGSKLRKEGR